MYDKDPRYDFYCQPDPHITCKTCSAENNQRCPAEMSFGAKMGSIAGGGVLGAMLGWRSSVIKKLILAGVGSTVATAMVYPDEAKQYASTTYCFVKENGDKAYGAALAAYNSMFGPKDKCQKPPDPCAPPPPPPPPPEPCPPEPPKC